MIMKHDDLQEKSQIWGKLMEKLLCKKKKKEKKEETVWFKSRALSLVHAYTDDQTTIGNTPAH